MRFVLLAAVLACGFWQAAHAQGLSAAALESLGAAQSALEQEDYARALEILRPLSVRGSAREKSEAQKLMGLTYAAQGNLAAAISAVESARTHKNSLNAHAFAQLTYLLAQLQWQADAPARALDLWQEWATLNRAPPPPHALALLARIHLQREDLAAAQDAISRARARTREPSQNFERIYLAVLLQQERYQEARPVLERAVELWPQQQSFWQQLGALYHALEEEQLVFAVAQSMAAQGWLLQTAERERLARLYLYHRQPARAAHLLKDIPDATTAQHYDLLAQALLQARQREAALAPLARAAANATTAQPAMRLGEAHIQIGDWRAAEAAFRQALAKSEPPQQGAAWLSLGIALSEQERWGEAAAALRKAGEYDAQARAAFAWLRRLEHELARR